ncbi:MAG: hypothetical protein Q8L02_05670, partial [Candidatus Nitrotoga sp.]|nr:hypothetical protein [Candidatus Nitrotoga sp.]
YYLYRRETLKRVALSKCSHFNQSISSTACTYTKPFHADFADENIRSRYLFHNQAINMGKNTILIEV